MIQTFYRIIYNRRINFFLRNINRLLLPLLPWKIKIPPSGVMKLKGYNRQGFKDKNKPDQLLNLSDLLAGRLSSV